MKGQPSENEAYTKLMEMCSHSEKSAYEIRQKLFKWGLEDRADKIIGQLKKENYVDDFRFVRAYTNDKYRFNKWGLNKIRFLLRKQDFTQEIIEKAFSEIDETEYRTMVFTELGKKKKTLRLRDPWKLRAKINAFANQRGYELDLINEFLESV